MTLQELNKIIVVEEIAEVTQVISKLARFGGEAVYNDETTYERLLSELHDLIAVFRMIGINIEYGETNVIDHNVTEQYCIFTCLSILNNLHYIVRVEDVVDENKVKASMHDLFIFISTINGSENYLVFDEARIKAKIEKVNKYNQLSFENGRVTL